MLLNLKVKNTRLAEHNILSWARKKLGEPQIGHEWFCSSTPCKEIAGLLREYIETEKFTDGTEIDSLQEFLTESCTSVSRR